MFNAFEQLFSPGRKHTQDEHNRLELTREDVGDGDPARGPIDLGSGKVVVHAPAPANSANSANTDTAPEPGAEEPSAGG